MNFAHLAACLAVTLAAPLSGVAATSRDAALARCAGIDAPERRLACYDDVVGRRTADSGAAVAAATPSATVASSEAGPGSAARATHAAPTASNEAATGGGATPDFGLTPIQRKPQQSGPESITARIAGITGDRVGRAILTLDNGQTWLVGDNDARLTVGQEVVIRRGALGSFLLTTAERHSYHVRRTR